MTLINYTNKLCTFCYKSVTDDCQNKGNTVKLFCELLKRFISDHQIKTSNVSVLAGLLECCRDCEYLVIEFCTVYHRMKCLELQLCSKLKTLVEVMRMADRVPARLKIVKQYFEDDALLQEEHQEVLNVHGQNQLTIFKSARTEILRNCQCGQAMSMIQPRIILKRMVKPAVPLVSSAPSFDTTSPRSSNDAFEVKVIMNSGATDEENEPVPEKLCDELEIKYDISTSTDSPVLSATDACTAQNIMNLSDNDDGNEHMPDEILDKLEIQNDINTSYDFPIQSEASFEKGSTQNGENDLVQISDIQNINCADNQIEMDIKTESVCLNQVDKSNIRVRRPFSCLRCPKRFVYEKHLKSHIWCRHRTDKQANMKKRGVMRRNLRKFRCGLCNIFTHTYQGIRSHKYSATHQILFRRNLKVRLIKKEKRTVSFQELYPEPNKINPGTKKESQSRSQNQFSVDEKNQCSENSEFYSTDSETNSDDSYSSSSHDDEHDIKISNEKYFYCRQDECKFTTRIFKRKIFLEEHRKLHKRGKYRCQFCDKVESTPIKLSLHECEMHSALPSTSTNKNDEGIFHCARCPFESKLEAIYYNHFTSIHLGIFNAKIGKDIWECEICLKKLINGKGRREIHFKTHHDTNGLEDPDSQIKRCDEDGCTAYFLSTKQLELHKEMKHSLKQISVDDEYDISMEEATKQGSIKCKLCEKVLSSLTFLQRHKRKFHNNKMSINDSEPKTEYPEKVYKYKRLVCPVQKCTKSFTSRIGLDNHKKFHANFQCNFCDHVVDYAPNLAVHENEMHCPQLKSKLSRPHKLSLINCSRCSKTFHFQNLYKIHFVKIHLDLPTVFGVCQICKHAADSEPELQSHIKLNHNIKNMDPSKISKCDLCPAYFRTILQLGHHKNKIHNTNDNPLKCKECDNVFRSGAGLQIHKNQVHSKKFNNEAQSFYNCVMDECKRKFPNKQLLERHQKLHERGEFPCQFCDCIYNTVLKLIMHETTKHSTGNTAEKLYRCSRCSYKNKFVARFQNHFAEVHTKSLKPVTDEERQMPGNFQCKICKMNLNYGSDLAMHEAQHNKPTGYYINCPRCSNILPNKTYVAHFLRTHLGTTSRRKECPICKVQTVRLDSHHKSCHKIEDPSKVYNCDFTDENCQAYFVKAAQLIRHKRKMHSNDSTCKECGKKLKSERTLSSHMQLLHPNSDENPLLPFACTIPNCKKRFSTKAESDYHQKRHNKNLCSNIGNVEETLNKFKCKICDKEFVSESRLKSHIFVAHKRSFICQVCGKVFKTKADLNMHLLYHKGPTAWKFQCATCGKKCVTKETLVSHMNTHTKEKSWICNFCGNTYAHQHNWKNHMLAKHGNEDNVPTKMKVGNTNRLSRKGAKQGTCLLVENSSNSI